MFPVLVKIGPFTIHTYGFLFAIGVFAGIMLTVRLAKLAGLDSKKVLDLLFFTILIALLGAKLFLFFTEFSYYTRDLARMKSLLTSGGTFYGGLILATLFAVWYIRRQGMETRKIADAAAPGIALGHFFGRLGCLSAGCCYGREAGESILGIVFTNGYAHGHTGVPLNTPLYPTQLLEAILNLINFTVLLILYKKRKFAGQVFFIYIFNYSLIRFILEYFRGDPDRGFVFGGPGHPFTSLSIPQLISMVGVATAVVLYRLFKKKGEKQANR